MTQSDTESSTAGGERSFWWVVACLILLTGALYGPTMARATFLGDDWFHIERVPADRIPHLFFGDWHLGYRHHGGFYRPLPRLAMQCGRLCFDLWAPGYLLFSALLHVLNGVLVWLVAMRLTGRLTVAWPAALVFAVYPTHPEALLQVSTVADPMATCGCLVLLAGYLGVRRAPTAGNWAVVAAGAGLGALSKESWIALPLALVLLERVWPDPPGRRLPGARAWLRLGAVMAFAAGYAGFRQVALGGTGGYGLALTPASVQSTFDAAFQLVLLPFVEIETSELLNVFSLLGGLVILWAVAGFPRLLLFAMGWMVLMSLPFLTLAPKLHDGGRLVYVVVIGWALYVGGLIDRIVQLGRSVRSRRTIGCALAAVAGVPLAAMLERNCADWRRSFEANERLVGATVRVAQAHPDAGRYAVVEWPRRFGAAQSNRPEAVARALSLLAGIEEGRTEALLAPDAPPGTITFAAREDLRLHAGRVGEAERWVWAGERLETWRPQGPARLAHARSDGSRSYVFASREAVLASPILSGRTGFYSVLLHYWPTRRQQGFVMWRSRVRQAFHPTRMARLRTLAREGANAKLANPGWLSALRDVLFVPGVNNETLTIQSIEIARFDILPLDASETAARFRQRPEGAGDPRPE